jgi:hypothetical protein
LAPEWQARLRLGVVRNKAKCNGTLGGSSGSASETGTQQYDGLGGATASRTSCRSRGATQRESIVVRSRQPLRPINRMGQASPRFKSGSLKAKVYRGSGMNKHPGVACMLRAVEEPPRGSSQPWIRGMPPRGIAP